MSDEIYDDSQDKSAGNGLKGYFTEGQGKAAYTGDKNYRSGEEIAVFIKINLLKHFKTRYGNETVECNAHAAHYAGGNGGEEEHEGGEEGDDDG